MRRHALRIMNAAGSGSDAPKHSNTAQADTWAHGRQPFTYTSRSETTHTGPIKWIHVADASLRIEAILSGQAIAASPVALPTSDLTRIVTVQPPRAVSLSAYSDHPPSFIMPIPHTVVVLRHGLLPKHGGSHSSPESRSRRLGRLSRQMMAKYLLAPAASGDEDCCPSCCNGRWCVAPFERPAAQNPMFMC